jgi:hypothetical protein
MTGIPRMHGYGSYFLYIDSNYVGVKGEWVKGKGLRGRV